MARRAIYGLFAGKIIDWLNPLLYLINWMVAAKVFFTDDIVKLTITLKGYSK